MKNLVVYHRVDFDGIFSGAIINYYLSHFPEEECDFLGWNYSDLLPDLTGYDKLWLVDLSFPKETMIEIKQSGMKIVWIDHHETSINASLDGNYTDLPGIRRIGTAAAELCWEYITDGKKETPKVVQYIGAYDVWDHSRFNWDNEVLPIQFALRTLYGIKLENLMKVFKTMVDMPNFTDELMENGRTICEYNRKRWSSAVKSFAFPIEIVGTSLKALCMLSTEFGSNSFASVSNEYDVFCVANLRESGNVYSVSLYSSGDESKLGDFSCGKFMADKYSGGGHKGAAGGTMTEEQFINLIKNKQL